MKLLIVNQHQYKLPQSFLKNWVKALTKELTANGEVVKGKQLILAFVNEQEIKTLNKTYRKKK